MAKPFGIGVGRSRQLMMIKSCIVRALEHVWVYVCYGRIRECYMGVKIQAQIT